MASNGRSCCSSIEDNGKMMQEQAANFANGNLAELFHNNTSSGWSSFLKFH